MTDEQLTFVRLPRFPRICRRRQSWTAKEQYYHQKTLERYYKTKDGQHFLRIIGAVVTNPELGNVDNFRVYHDVEQTA